MLNMPFESNQNENMSKIKTITVNGKKKNIKYKTNKIWLEWLKSTKTVKNTELKIWITVVA